MSTGFQQIEEILIDHPDDEVDCIIAELFQSLQGVLHASRPREAKHRQVRSRKFLETELWVLLKKNDRHFLC